MNLLQSVLDWFAGNGAYMKLTHCMGHDYLWITITVSLDLANALGYSIIAFHWWRNGRLLPRIPAKMALADIRNIFIFCGVCGYLFIPIKMFWPAWRLYDCFLAVLVFYTWKYALGSRDLKVVYKEIGRTTQLASELEKSLEESRRKSVFLDAISHDLRTPLNGLMLQTSVAEMSLADPEALKQSLTEIRASAAATAGLLDSLLEFARLDWSEGKNTITSFDLSEMISGTLQSLKSSADEKNIELKMHCPNDVRIATDRGKLHRVLVNLVNNAIKFTNEGTVRVDVEAASLGVEIHVIDSGIGIAAEHQGKLFDEFYQVHNHERDRKKGFGLGLSISRRLARQLGGDVVVDSAPGRGSRFSIVLPNVKSVDSPGQRGEQAERASTPSVAG